ncbi:uncharacterized protein BXZ73DRAFT_101909 [Epithele typhae]|uniref:uncharacterized protein n=1 Tax=Epithele typhae TaxID=378194 RepID=UPI002008B507|nr:uncharacterized protein BXZ73DRAFT_101909 [Epithele typhae]KAH9930537.1 hypothetical protein BXZ73DRAFT_101909 [Epithele typhae]
MSRIIITGATGVAGLAVYRAALTDPAVAKVTLLTRRAVPAWAVLPPNAAEKTETIIHADFKTYPPELAARLAEHDALVWAMGKTSAGMSEQAYTELTLEYPVAAARALTEAGAGSGRDAPFRFVYVSGEQADPTEKSRQMWARVKGRAERELPEIMKDANMKTHVFRPGYFFPSKDYPEDRQNLRGPLLRGLDAVIGPVFNTLAPSAITPTELLGRFCVDLAKGRWPEQDLSRNGEMRTMMKDVPFSQT